MARRLIVYQTGEADAVSDINPNVIKNSGLKGYESVFAYAYENVAVSLKKNGFKLTRINDLANHSLVSWQGAKTMLGGEYAAMAEKNKKYREVADQKTQIKLLYGGREDVIQLDRQIFKYYRNRVAKEKAFNTNQPIDIFPLFGKNECSFLFRDKKVQEIFDRNFKKLKKSGGYDKIFRKYTD
jgi:polar amino acid transport system substrate-binding protein